MEKKTFDAALPRILLVCLLIGLSFITFYPVFAQDEGEVQDSFDDPSLSGWEHSQNVRVSDGILKIDPDNAAFKLGSWDSPSISIQLRFSSPGGVIVHYHASEQGAYHLHLFREGEQLEIFLEKEFEGSHTNLGETKGAELLVEDWNSLEITLQDGTHRISLNESEVLSVFDEDFLPPGGIGFMVVGENTADFDNLVIRSGAAMPAIQQGEGEMPPEEEVPPEMEQEQERELPPASIQTTPQVTPQPGTGTRSLLEDFLISGTNPIDLSTYAINLGMAALLSFILSRVYIYWGASLSNRRKFGANFMLMTVTTTFIILVVRSSVALSLGLVGALSIVRFRAAIKEPEELAYLFLAIGLGIGLGDNQRLVTLLAFTAALVVLGLMKILRHSQADINMHLTVSGSFNQKPEMDQILEALKPYCAKCKLVRFEEHNNLLELSFIVELVRVSDLSKTRNALQEQMPGASITFLDNKGIW